MPTSPALKSSPSSEFGRFHAALTPEAENDIARMSKPSSMLRAMQSAMASAWKELSAPCATACLMLSSFTPAGLRISPPRRGS